ncbi:hypothetical protein ACC692_38045, partial [Rhizobium ruizarguesonis]
GLRPAFDRACQRPNGFVHVENHFPEPLDLIIEFLDLDFVKAVTQEQSPTLRNRSEGTCMFEILIRSALDIVGRSECLIEAM